MTREEAKLTIDCLKEMQEGYIEGEGYERHPVPEWYALDKAIKALEQEPRKGQLTNSEWIDFLSEQFDISRTSAREMLHVMMSVKKEDNFKKKQFRGRK